MFTTIIVVKGKVDGHPEAGLGEEHTYDLDPEMPQQDLFNLMISQTPQASMVVMPNGDMVDTHNGNVRKLPDESLRKTAAEMVEWFRSFYSHSTLDHTAGMGMTAKIVEHFKPERSLKNNPS